MSLMVILICLIAERFLLDHQHLRQMRWLDRFSQWLAQQDSAAWMRQGIMRVVTLLLPPLLLAGIAQQLFANTMFGLLGVIFAGLVLLYTLGPDDLDSQIDAYTRAVEDGDDESIKEIAREIIGDEPPTSEPALSQAVAEGTLFQANQRIFAVLFWFLLLGPMGALLYRLSTRLPQLEYANRDLDFYLNAKQLVVILDWLPARVTAVCYAIAGSFEDALYGWRSFQGRRFDEFSDSNSGTLICTGGGAMRLTTLLDESNEALQDYSHLPQSAMALIWRSLVVFLVIIAVLTFTGIF
ncbi:MAG: regulatory signaling modulator protein AmpE [Candidatus Thiodiazotropha sp. (ex Semelilucina semeliformis)]|nr:regulatory signaling modulator protein AmpE [Candidatus Thiodiazotropha sp. (ex Semelilucina semeliformis)]